MTPHQIQRFKGLTVVKFIVCAASVAIAAPALAQNASNFEGGKAGIVLGYDTVNFDYGYDVDASESGMLYGVTAGYDFALGTSGAILGIEAEASDSTTKTSAHDILFEGDKLSLLADRDLYIGARIGFAVSPNMLLYAKGGYTNARLKLRYSLDGDSASIGDNIDGYRIGGGAEFTNGSNFARLEYRHSDYGKYVYREGGIELDTGVKMSRHQVAVTGGFHF